LRYKESFSDDGLTIEAFENEHHIDVIWRGSSDAINPGIFVQPVLTRIITVSNRTQKPIRLDFRNLQSMSPSLITAILETVSSPGNSNSTFSIAYDENIDWQKAHFMGR